VKGRPVGSAPGRWKKRLGNDCEDEWFVSGMKELRVGCDRWRWWCADLLATAGGGLIGGGGGDKMSWSSSAPSDAAGDAVAAAAGGHSFALKRPCDWWLPVSLGGGGGGAPAVLGGGGGGGRGRWRAGRGRRAAATVCHDG
jgi:hypothetical protein